MTYQVSFIGIDGGGKSSCIDECVRLLELEFSIATLGKQTFFIKPGSKSQLYAKTDELTGKIYSKNRPALSRALHRVTKTILWPMKKRRIIRKYGPDLLIEDRDQIVDPSVLSRVYLPRIASVPINYRINILRLVTFGGLSNLYVKMDCDAKTGYERIILRNIQKSSGLSPHESLHNLELLQNEYRIAAEYLKKRHVRLLEINTTSAKFEDYTEKLSIELRTQLKSTLSL